MTKEELEGVLIRVAKANNTMPDHVRSEIEAVMNIGMQNPDPEVQAKWTRIPRKGDRVTLEEFLEYVVSLTVS